MRKIVLIACAVPLVATAACGRTGLNRDRPDEFAVARQAPLVIPPDFALVPPQPGAAAQLQGNVQEQTLEALFGGPAQRSSAETTAIEQAGANAADPGVRSEVGDAQTNVIDKGTTTQQIIAAPEGDGENTRAGVPQ